MYLRNINKPSLCTALWHDFLYPGMLACFSTNYNVHFAGEQDTSGLHYKYEVSKLYVFHSTVDSDLVVVVLTDIMCDQ